MRSYESRPDLAPVVLQVRASEQGLAPGSIFLAPKRGPGQGGPLIAGADGQPIWFLPLPGGRRATDFRVQEYAGRRVLTWWEGIATGGQGEGEGIIADESYRVIARVKAGNGLKADLHEFKLTPRGTALLTIYHTRNRDLRAFGGPRRGRVIDGVVQEVDIATGRVLFQWRSMGQVGLRESYDRVPRTRAPFDYVHINSADMDAAGRPPRLRAPHARRLQDPQVDREGRAGAWAASAPASGWGGGRASRCSTTRASRPTGRSASSTTPPAASASARASCGSA